MKNEELNKKLEELIPEHCRESLHNYIFYGAAAGEFLYYLLCNDLRETFFAADDINMYRIHDYVAFLYSYAPSDCWGSPGKVHEWIKHNGLDQKDD
jgi:hypothetical protein